jgi:hypothetical protein
MESLSLSSSSENTQECFVSHFLYCSEKKLYYLLAINDKIYESEDSWQWQDSEMTKEQFLNLYEEKRKLNDNN